MPYDAKCKWCGRYFEKPALLSIKSAYQGERRNYCSDKCYNEAISVNGGGVNQQIKDSNGNEDLSAEQILAKAEAQKIAHQIEMEEKAARDASDKEFMESIKRNWKVWTSVLVIIIGFFAFLTISGNNKKQDAIKLNHELEMIEDQVKLLIQSGEKEKALELTNKLIHPIHEVYEGKGGYFNAEYYDTYWDKKREQYKEEVLKLHKVKATTPKPTDEGESEIEQVVEESTEVDTNDAFTNSSNN